MGHGFHFCLSAVPNLFHTHYTFHREAQLAQLSRRAYAGFMAQPDCPLCGGTGWKTVDRVAEEEKLTRGSWEKPIEGTNATKRVWAVPCDCTGKDRTARTIKRARIPNRYEHCDFDNFDTDLYEDSGKFEPVEGAAFDRSLAQARLEVEGFSREFPMGCLLYTSDAADE